MATACDVRIAAESAKIAFLFTKVGLSGADMGAAWLLPRIVGHGLASGAPDGRRVRVGAQRALSRWGCTTEVVPDDELEAVLASSLGSASSLRGLQHGPGRDQAHARTPRPR